jgi:hypothetical protein
MVQSTSNKIVQNKVKFHFIHEKIFFTLRANIQRKKLNTIGREAEKKLDESDSFFIFILVRVTMPCLRATV